LRCSIFSFLCSVFRSLFVLCLLANCLSFIKLRLLITSLVSFGHFIVCPSSSYGFWLLLWYLLAIILSVRHRVTASDYFFGIFWPLYCLYYVKFSILKSINGWIYIPNKDISNLGLRPRSAYYYLVNKSWHLPHQKPIIVYKHIIVRVFYLGTWNILR
jgi:hypothetical protein